MELAHSLLKRLLLEQDAAAKTCINADTGFFAQAPPAGAGCRNKRVSTLMRTLFLRQNRLKLSKGVFTGDESGLG